MKHCILPVWGICSILAALGCAAQAQPVNDNFANRTVLTGTNITVTGSTVGATREAGEPYHAEAYGGSSVWWRWTSPRAGAATITTAGSSFDTVLAIYTGSTISALTEVASSDDEDYPSISTSKVVFNTVAGQTYQIAVDGYSAATGNVQLQVVLGAPQPAPPAPAWYLPDPNGLMVGSSEFAGKVVLLNFWATWCSPCKAEMPDFVALQDKYRDDGLVIIGADIGLSGDTAAVVRSFLSTWTPSINYQIIMANSAMMQAYGGIGAVPTTFLIDRQNLVQKKWVGTQSGSTLEKEMIPLLYRDTRVACEMNGGQVTVRWPNTTVPFSLESCADPSTSAWLACPAPTIINGTNTTQMSVTDSARFFRLKMNY